MNSNNEIKITTWGSHPFPICPPPPPCCLRGGVGKLSHGILYVCVWVCAVCVCLVFQDSACVCLSVYDSECSAIPEWKINDVRSIIIGKGCDENYSLDQDIVVK